MSWEACFAEKTSRGRVRVQSARVQEELQEVHVYDFILFICLCSIYEKRENAQADWEAWERERKERHRGRGPEERGNVPLLERKESLCLIIIPALCPEKRRKSERHECSAVKENVERQCEREGLPGKCRGELSICDMFRAIFCATLSDDREKRKERAWGKCQAESLREEVRERLRERERGTPWYVLSKCLECLRENRDLKMRKREPPERRERQRDRVRGKEEKERVRGGVPEWEKTRAWERPVYSYAQSLMSQEERDHYYYYYYYYYYYIIIIICYILSAMIVFVPLYIREEES